MNIFQSIVLGILQGLGEFLPISSTAHLILAPWFFGWNDPGLSFDVALHLGTLIAVVGFFWKDWLIIFQLAFRQLLDFFLEIFYPSRSNRRKIIESQYPSQLLWLLVIASVPGAIFGILLNDKAEEAFRSPLLIAFTLSVIGVIIFLADKYVLSRKEMRAVTFWDAFWIGLSQAIAILPGVSRSGATMATGLFLGLSREQAARFSFLLSTPIIFGAAIVKVPQLIETGIDMAMIFGIMSAAITGYLAIKYMLRFIQKVGYGPFLWYRLALAAVVVMVYFLR
ncbi:MAG: undecaprenyl-diphosphate phosphatase [Candidatus Moranbacteria bacterium]|nr:undecaprenyl-diphosphate phosphatase [Candidatus Moranbacteria bacterium]